MTQLSLYTKFGVFTQDSVKFHHSPEARAVILKTLNPLIWPWSYLFAKLAHGSQLLCLLRSFNTLLFWQQILTHLFTTQITTISNKSR